MRRRWIAGFAILLSLSAAHAVQKAGWFGDLTYLGVTVGAGVLGLLVATRRPRVERAAWTWLASGVAASGVADVFFAALHHINGVQPDVSIADVFYLGSYVALSVGLLGLFGLRGTAGKLDVDALIDLASFVTLAVIVVFATGDVSGFLTDESTPLAAELVWAAYPILDAALLALLLEALVKRRLHGRSGLLLSTGVACWLASDFATLLVADMTVQRVWMDLGWMWGAAAIAAAVAVRPPSPAAAPTRRRECMDLLLGMLPLALPGLIASWSYLRGGDPNPLAMFVLTIVLIGLAYVRSLRLVRARERQHAELERRERYYQALAENSADGVIVVGSDDRLLHDAPSMTRMLGRAEPVTAGMSVIELFEPVDREQATAVLHGLRTATGNVKQIEFRAMDAEGVAHWFGLRARNLEDDPAVQGLVLNMHDITDRKRAEHELGVLAFHDSLTALPNRALFHDRLEHALQRNQRSGVNVAIAYLDVDGFKLINDGHGHDMGDEVLKQIAGRLVATIRPEDTVARLGGDEFAVLVEHASQPLEHTKIVADRIQQALREPMSVGDAELGLSVSIGIAVGDGMSTAGSLLRDADIARYQAKSSGKGTCRVFDAEMRAAAVDRMAIEADLEAALARRQFELMYQPVVRLDSDEVVGFEALLRWHHPARGMVMPDVFIPIAEETGSIGAIGEWVLNEACRTAAGWRSRFPDRSMSMAVNLSARQLAAPDIVDQVRSALLDTGVHPGLLVLEMTETALVRDPDATARRLHELSALGVKIAIDDFGTGYSSLSYLRQFPADILKIDRSFVNTIGDGADMPAIVRGMLDLAKTLHLDTIAEGIETDVQRDGLRAQRCEFGQGYLFAKPLPEADAEALLGTAGPCCGVDRRSALSA